MINSSKKASLIWSVADLIRGSWKQHECQDVVSSLVVLKKLNSILKDTKFLLNNDFYLIMVCCPK